MEWIGPALLAVIGVSTLFQLITGYALSVIARKSETGSLMEILAWIPGLQFLPMIAVGGGSIARFFLGFLGLMIAAVALGVATSTVGGSMGAVIGPIGIFLLFSIVIAYSGYLFWNTATQRDLPGWIGLLMFIPVVNFFVYPYIAFHDGWEAPHTVGMMLGVMITLGTSLPYITLYQQLQDPENIPEGFEALMQSVERGALEASVPQQGAEVNDLENIALAQENAPPQEQAALPTASSPASESNDETSLRALLKVKNRFDALESLASPEALRLQKNRVRASALAQAVRSELAESQPNLEPKAYQDLSAHLDRIEDLISLAGSGRASSRSRLTQNRPARSNARSGQSSSPAALAPSRSIADAPSEPFPVKVADNCPAGTELRERTGDKGEEEWCQQLDQYGGLRHGWYARYFDGGKPEQVGEYREGLRIGVWTRFYPSGAVRAQAEFDAGLQHGWLLSFDEAGAREKAIRFDQGAPL